MLSKEIQLEVNKGAMLPLMEEFYTIQGEGFHTGTAAYFIRIGGCDVGCHWCDVKESWDASKHKTYSVDEIASWVQNSPSCTHVVITGGEPSEYDLSDLTAALKAIGQTVCIETAATHALTGQLDWICISPKKRQPPLLENMPKAHELKVIVYNQDDFAWAEKWAQTVSPTCRLYLQAEWDKREEIGPKIIEYVKQNPRWKISVQTHKYLNIP